MKITTKNLGVLFCMIGVIGIILISGCIGEKSKEEQPEPVVERPEAEQPPAEIIKEEQAEKEPEKKVNETIIEKEPGKKLNETPQVEPEDYTDWCGGTAATTIVGGRGGTVWIEGVIEFKGKPMCHARYFSITAGKATQYDWYFTKNEEEIYRVITYPDGRKEESKIENPKEVEDVKSPFTTIGKTNKDPSKMLLELNDLPAGYNIIEDRTGEITEERHVCSSEQLIELCWEGGYAAAFDNKKLYLFSLSLSYKQYLKTGAVDEQLKEAFKDNKISLSNSDMISRIDDKNWKIQDKDWIRKSKIEYYIIEETDKDLKIYEESLSNFMSYRYILNINSVYSPDKIKEVFNDAKQRISASAVKLSNPMIGDESILYKKELTEDDKEYTAYILIFRKLNVYESIEIVGLSGFVEEREAIKLAEIVEEKIT